MSVNARYIVKVSDARKTDILKACEQAGLKTRNIMGICKEEVAPAKQ
jgi:hypothetical protein